VLDILHLLLRRSNHFLQQLDFVVLIRHDAMCVFQLICHDRLQFASELTVLPLYVVQLGRQLANPALLLQYLAVTSEDFVLVRFNQTRCLTNSLVLRLELTFPLHLLCLQLK
jgi:hypothetical protein